MKVIVCLDDQNGMLFNNRRQSRDARVCERILARAGENPLWMNAYSLALFGEDKDIQVCEDFLELAGEDDYCFVENIPLDRYFKMIKEIVIYRWNRDYPRDLLFPVSKLSDWALISRSEFSGSSHEAVTEEVYTR